MNKKELFEISALNELATAVLHGKTTAHMLTGVIKVMRQRMGLISGEFVMQHNTFWSAEKMLGFDFKDLTGVFGKWKTTRIFEGELGELITAEVLTEQDMNARFPNHELACDTENGISTIRIPLRYRQSFIGFFIFTRKEDDWGEKSERIAALMELVGGLIADVAETRTNQLIERGRLIAQNRRLKKRIEPVAEDIIGESDSMREVYTQVRQVAPTDATVLIRGSSGTGKELIARSIVALSPRKGRPFLTINCAALPETLIESELFGHEKGSFTGAVDRRIGRAEAANGGTLFLDEIGDLTPATQVKLLRFLQERTFSRLGSNVELHSDVRFIAATSRNLEDLMARKLFREDLYYRLNIFSIQVPDLTERRGDILLLAHHFAKKFNIKYRKDVKKLSPEVTAVFIDYKWPGNVRELENCVERAVLTATDETIRLANLPPAMRPAGYVPGVADDAGAGTEGKTLDEMTAGYEKSVISSAVEKHNGNLSAAARALGISPRMMYYKMGRLGIQREGLARKASKVLS
jgi:Nif-specific regulatory protein